MGGWNGEACIKHNNALFALCLGRLYLLCRIIYLHCFNCPISSIRYQNPAIIGIRAFNREVALNIPDSIANKFPYVLSIVRNYK